MSYTVYCLYLVYLKSSSSLRGLLPYVVLGVLAGELLRYTSWVNMVQRMSSRRPTLSIVLSTVVGAVSPLCTYGTVPVVAELVKTRMGMAPVVAFLSASSLMNPQLFILTWGGVGWKIAVFRLAAILVFGVLLGLLIRPIPDHWIVNRKLLDEGAKQGSCYTVRKFSWRDYTKRSFRTLLFVGKYLVLGVVLGAAVEVYFPSIWILKNINRNWVGLLAVIAVSAPLSACGGGVIPLVRSMLNSGLDTGSALAFFIAGPAMRPSPLSALASVLRPAAVGVYLVLVVVFAMMSGLIVRAVGG